MGRKEAEGSEASSPLSLLKAVEEPGETDPALLHG